MSDASVSLGRVPLAPGSALIGSNTLRNRLLGTLFFVIGVVMVLGSALSAGPGTTGATVQPPRQPEIVQADTTPFSQGATAKLHAKAAWTDGWVTEPSLAANFPAPAGGSFVGAKPHNESTLVTANAQLRVTQAAVHAAAFYRQFASRAQGGTSSARQR